MSVTEYIKNLEYLKINRRYFHLIRFNQIKWQLPRVDNVVYYLLLSLYVSIIIVGVVQNISILVACIRWGDSWSKLWFRSSIWSSLTHYCKRGIHLIYLGKSLNRLDLRKPPIWINPDFFWGKNELHWTPLALTNCDGSTETSYWRLPATFWSPTWLSLISCSASSQCPSLCWTWSTTGGR